MSHPPAPDHAAQPLPNSRAALGGVLFLTLTFLVTFLSRMSLSPLLPAMEKELQFNHAQAGSIFFFGSLGYALVLALSGWVSFKLNHRRTIMLSIIGTIAAMVSLLTAQGLNGLRLGSILAGMAGGFYLPSGIASLTALVPRAKYGWALAIHEFAPNLSFILAPLLAELVLNWVGWRGAPAILLGASVIMFFLFIRFGKASENRGRPLDLSLIKQIVTRRALWAATGGLTLAAGAVLGGFAMLPLFLVYDHGFDQTTMNLLLAISRGACLITVFFSGTLCDRLGAFKALTIFLILTGFFTIMLGLTSGMWLWLFIFLQPMTASCLFPPSLSLVALCLPQETRNLGISMASVIATTIGAGVMPIGVGYLGEIGHFGLGFALIGGITLVGALCLHWLGGEEVRSCSN